ncbi:glycoside hydrolase family 16 protein [Dietzia sp. CH92]|uniref:glycoside hydrolase family 16 protein n=1 Tax=Dietzia sp. CH92 TaxID=3051823 RepID=UPI0028D4E85D|nr:glycoside hydrolase family 16 protein [Dietzia sp. CH92]
MTDSDISRPRRTLVATGAVVAALSVTIASCTVDVRFGMERAGAETTTLTPAAATTVTSTPETGVRHLLAAEIAEAPLILDEDFSGYALDTSVWNTCHWWDDGGCTIASNDELEWYLPSQVAVRDGALELTAERRDVVGADGTTFPYTSGMVTTGPPVHDGLAKLAFTYGAVEVEFRAPLGAGLWPAIWMLPASENSKPEIDMFEAVGQRPDQVSMFFHPKIDPDRNVSHTRVYLPEGQTLADPHVVRLEWSPGLMDFYLDGEKVWQVTGAQVPDEPMYLVMNLAVGGVFGGTPDPSAFPATFSIDHVRIWSGGTQ